MIIVCASPSGVCGGFHRRHLVLTAHVLISPTPDTAANSDLSAREVGSLLLWLYCVSFKYIVVAVAECTPCARKFGRKDANLIAFLVRILTKRGRRLGQSPVNTGEPSGRRRRRSAGRSTAFLALVHHLARRHPTHLNIRSSLSFASAANDTLFASGLHFAIQT